MSSIIKCILENPLQKLSIATKMLDISNASLEDNEKILSNIIPDIIDLQKQISRLNNSLNNKTKLTDVKLGQYLLQNPELLNGFEIKKLNNKDTIYYDNSCDADDIRRAFNTLKRQITEHFGFSNNIHFKMLAEVILYVHDIQQKNLKDKTFLIKNFLSSVKNQFRMSDLKKAIPNLEISPKEIEKILLDLGCTIKKYDSSRVKYFVKPKKDDI